MNSLIVGYGEIGKAVKEVIAPYDHVNVYDTALRNGRTTDRVDVLHVCFPPSRTFIPDVKTYVGHYDPAHVLIWASVPIGTTKQIKGAVHTPVEGKHPDLAKSIQTMTRWLGTTSQKEGLFFCDYFNRMAITCHLVKDANYTEALKLLSTTEYGINIEFARYKKQVADSLSMDYELMKQWNTDYNELYKELGLDDKYQKFVLDAPEGPKGGHCVTQNAKLLHDQYPSDLTKIVGEL